MSVRWLRKPTTWLAIVLVAIGGAAVYAGRHDKLREWASNAGVTAFALATTVTVVERIVRSEERASLRPRAEYAACWICLALRELTTGVVMDYAETHRATFREIPDDARRMFEMWLRGFGGQDRPRAASALAPEPSLFVYANLFSRALERARERDLDVLASDLVLEIDEYVGSVERARGLIGAHGVSREALALNTCVEAALKFANGFERYGALWLVILPATRESARYISQRADP